jgi:predicted KAP-like P-loop ATPase
MNFSPERPIQSLKQDLLSRAAFVRSITAAIKGWNCSESLVIAISGPWGSGKSSVKNMIKDSLRSGNSDVQVVEFNPWEWAGHGQLAAAFFSEIEIALGKNPSRNSKKTAAKLNLYSARLRLGRFLSDTTFHIVTRLISLAIGSGLAWSILTQHFWLGLLFLLLAGLSLGAGKLFSLSSELVFKLRDIEEAKATLYESSMEDFKAELREELKRLAGPILIVIDDIDRLTAPQIGLLLQLVKANADFPNLIYMLLMEREIVEKALDSLAAGNGKYYLEKIVQVSLTLPQTARGVLIQILEREALALLTVSSPLKQEDELRFSSSLATISPYMKTLRNVHRLINALAFDVSVLRGDRSLSVNKIDLFCLAALKTLHEEIYRCLPRYKSLLTQQRFGEYDNDNVRLVKDSIAALCRQDNQAVLTNLLAFLFPNFPWTDDEFLAPAHVNEDEALTDLRICHNMNFDRYFVCSIEPDDISPEEFDALAESLGKREVTCDRLLDFHKRGVLLSVFERLLAYGKTPDIRRIDSLLIALFDISDQCLPDWETDSRSAVDRALILLSSMVLGRIAERSQRLEVLSKATGATTGLYLPIAKVALEGPDSKRQIIGSLTQEELEPLRQECVERIRVWASDARLLNHPALGYLILRWDEWTESDECKNWVAAQITSKEGALKLCSSVQDREVNLDGVRYSVRLDLLEKVADINLLNQILSKFDRTELTDKESTSVDRFLVAFEQRGVRQAK